MNGGEGVEVCAGSVAIDARGLHASGIGRYLRELLTHWFTEPPFETLRLLGDVAAVEAFVAARATRCRVEIVAYGGGFYSARSQVDWARRVRRSVADSDVAFFPHWDAPLFWFPDRAVLTVHDLIPFRVRETTTPLRRAAGAFAFRRSISAATEILCVSRATAADLSAMYPATRAKLSVVPNGATRLPAAPAGLAAALPERASPPFVLFVGNHKPHKNLDVAIEAVARARTCGHDSLTLVVAGRGAGGRALDHAGTRAHAFVRHVGEVDDETLAALYAGAEALLFPSRYEGFGLPVLEAMAMGTPVIASAIPAVTEVAGDAAVLVPPHDAAQMAGALDTLLRAPEARRAIVVRGERRAAAFSWRRAALETAGVLQAVARGERPTPTVPRRVAPR